VALKPPTSLLTFLRSLKSDIEDNKIDKDKAGESFAKVLQHLEETKEKCAARSDAASSSAVVSYRESETIAAMEEFIVAASEMALFMKDGTMDHLTRGIEIAEMADIRFQDTLSHIEREVISVLKHKTYFVEPE
jgi:hypothetical protein